jgi:hypothetical protein
MDRWWVDILMTSPAQIIRSEGVDETIKPGITALLNVLQEKQQRALQQQQIDAQVGQLTLERTKFDEELKAQREKKKALDEAMMQLQQEAAKLRAPGPMMSQIRAAFASQDPRLIEAAMTEVNALAGNQRVEAVRKRYDALRQQNGGQLSPELQISELQEMMMADHDNPQNGAFANTANSIRQGMRPKTQRWLRAEIDGKDIPPSEKYPNGGTPGRTYVIYRSPETGAQEVMGEKSETATQVRLRLGSAAEQQIAMLAPGMRKATDGMAALEKVVAKSGKTRAFTGEVEHFLAALENAGNVKIPIAGATPESALRQYGMANLSKEGQQYVRHIFVWRAARNFSKGGRTLTPTEIAESGRGFLSTVGEDPESANLAKQYREDETIIVENMGGAATDRAKRGTSVDPNAPQTPAPEPAKRKFVP